MGRNFLSESVAIGWVTVLNYDRLRLDIRKKIFTVNVVENWHRLQKTHPWNHSRSDWTGLWTTYLVGNVLAHCRGFHWMIFKGPLHTKLFSDSMSNFVIYYIINIASHILPSSSPFLLTKPISSHIEGTLTNSREICAEMHRSCCLGMPASMSRLLHKNNGNKFQSYQAENSHSGMCLTWSSELLTASLLWIW